MANGYSTEQNVGSAWPASQISPLFGPKSQWLMPKLPGCTRKMMANPMMPRWYEGSLCQPRPWGSGQRQSSRNLPCERHRAEERGVGEEGEGRGCGVVA